MHCRAISASPQSRTPGRINLHTVHQLWNKVTPYDTPRLLRRMSSPAQNLCTGGGASVTILRSPYKGNRCQPSRRPLRRRHALCLAAPQRAHPRVCPLRSHGPVLRETCASPAGSPALKLCTSDSWCLGAQRLGRSHLAGPAARFPPRGECQRVWRVVGLGVALHCPPALPPPRAPK